MRGRSVKQAEKLLLAATLLIFFLLLFLKNIPTSLFLSLPVEAPPAAAGEFSVKDTFTGEEVQLPGTAMAPYTLGEAQRRDLRVRLVVTNKGKTPSTNIRLDVPLLGELDSPYQTAIQETFSHVPQEIKREAPGNRSALFQINSLAPGESETLTLNYQLQAYPLKAELPALTALSTTQVYYPAAYSPSLVSDPGQLWLEPAAKIESDHPEIINRAQELTAPAHSELEKARLIFNFVKDHVQYDLYSPHRNKGALSALRNATGVCEDYAALFVALCRAAGIPARQVNGYADPQGRGAAWKLVPAETLSLKGCRHSWAEFYLEGAGWLPADPTLNIYDAQLTYFASLPQAGHLAQNYADQSLRVRFQGGQLAVAWEEELAGP